MKVGKLWIIMVHGWNTPSFIKGWGRVDTTSKQPKNKVSDCNNNITAWEKETKTYIKCVIQSDNKGKRSITNKLLFCFSVAKKRIVVGRLQSSY